MLGTAPRLEGIQPFVFNGGDAEKQSEETIPFRIPLAIFSAFPARESALRRFGLQITLSAQSPATPVFAGIVLSIASLVIRTAVYQEAATESLRRAADDDAGETDDGAGFDKESPESVIGRIRCRNPDST
ncbi:hypothetical protein B0H14DRAFT_3523593 [Mycena olivaceomarginata]|nr:hypothetical protein B0H14DRAFT_3523593 [Mycena olivaceomarginata]